MITKASPLDAIYSRIPRLRCKGLCRESCGPIPISEPEAKAIIPITPKHAMTNDFGFTILFDPKSGNCPHLTAAGRCAIYASRPLICRLWGTVKAMRCPHGCKPDRWVTDEEARGLLKEASNDATEHTPGDPGRASGSGRDVRKRSFMGTLKDMQVALYARGFDAAERKDVENQLLALRRYCDHSGLYSIEAEYVDWTSSEDEDRPEFQRLLEDARKSRFLQVVFWSLDQLSRAGAAATLGCLDQLTSCHVSWRCIADPCFDPGGPYSRSPGEIPAALARQERRRISALTKAGLDRARRAGKTLGGY